VAAVTLAEVDLAVATTDVTLAAAAVDMLAKAKAGALSAVVVAVTSRVSASTSRTRGVANVALHASFRTSVPSLARANLPRSEGTAAVVTAASHGRVMLNVVFLSDLDK
jgi:hypothetical protein